MGLLYSVIYIENNRRGDMKKSQDVRIKHSVLRRIWGGLALVALFACGVIVGLDFSKVSKKSESKPADGLAVSFSPNANIDFTNINVGEAKSHNVHMAVSAPLTTVAVKPIDGISGLKVTNDCADVAVVNERGGCDILVEYTPRVAVDLGRVPLVVGWADEAGEEFIAELPILIKVTDPNQKETCVVIEELLARDLQPENSSHYEDHEWNIKIYEKMVMNGCSENQMKYHKMAQREREILAALQQPTNDNNQQTCKQIEELLIGQLPSANGNAEYRIERAKIYANLSERGCAENSAKYVELAKQELEIARALEDDRFDNNDTVAVVETYKRLNMQAAAEEIFETAKKLTNPAIDFILEVEKIINEK